jgi:hypothetical protein
MPTRERRQHPRKTADAERVVSKLVKATTAKTSAGSANYLVDAFADELMGNASFYEILRFAVEVLSGKGPPEKRARTWLKKSLRYRR